MHKYERGDTVRVDVTFRDAAGDLIDPSTPRYSVYKPDGVTFLADQDLTYVSLGCYRADVQLEMTADIGYWTIKVWGFYTIGGGSKRILNSDKFKVEEVND